MFVQLPARNKISMSNGYKETTRTITNTANMTQHSLDKPVSMKDHARATYTAKILKQKTLEIL